MRNLLRNVLSLAVLVGVAGCAPWATYPPVETSAAAKVSKPTYEPVPTVIAAAVRHMRDRHMGGEDVAINLPEGAPAEAYDKVIERLGWGKPMTEPNEKAVHIVEVRTRGFNAQADVIFARPGGLNQMMTLTMRRATFGGYEVTAVRPWNLRAMATPKPNYVAPPPPTPEETTETASANES